MSANGTAFGAGAGVATIFGPVNRVSFHDEQARRRLGTWRMALACLLIATAMGIVTSAIAGPAVMLIAGGLLHLAAWLGIEPAYCLQTAHAVGQWVASRLELLQSILDGLDDTVGWPSYLAAIRRLPSLLTAFVPGLIASALLWIGFRRLLRRDRADDLIEALNARAPNLRDPEERQLSNIVEEVAIAAGLPPPRLMMVDQPAANAAAVGSSHKDATLLVTRGLLDTLNRDETLAIVAHLVASVGNGDFAVMRSLLAVFQVKGFFLTLLDLPFRRSAWVALSRLIAAIVWRRGSRSVELAAHSIEHAISADAMEEINRTLSEGRFATLRMALMFLLTPLMLVVLMQKFTIQIWTMFFLNWPLAALWRTRRYLADSTAVQLTRNPEALRSALLRLAESGAVLAGGEARDYLFVHAAGHPQGGFVTKRGITDAIQPSIHARASRIAAQGGGTPRWRINPKHVIGYVVLTLILSPLLGMLVVLVGLMTLGTTFACLGLGLAAASAILT
jgi:Zn-dependent protease with chaperone function